MRHMKGFRTAFLAMLIGVMPGEPALAGRYEDGVAAFQKGSYDVAIEILLPLAEDGDAQAQTAVGYIYLKRPGYNDDLREAQKWLRLAAEQGDAPAQHLLGTTYVGNPL
jgi:TPR repeat protein